MKSLIDFSRGKIRAAADRSVVCIDNVDCAPITGPPADDPGGSDDRDRRYLAYIRQVQAQCQPCARCNYSSGASHTVSAFLLTDGRRELSSASQLHRCMSTA